MIKRVNLCRFKQTDVGRKMQQCFKLETVDANGGPSPCDGKCLRDIECEGKQASSTDSFVKAKTCDCHSSKSNILNTIRRKWRRSRRNKRCDSRNRSDSQLNVVSSNVENSDLVQCGCAKHPRMKKQKPGTKITVWPVPLPVLRSQRHIPCKNVDNGSKCKWNNHLTEDSLSEPGQCSNEDNPDCSCFGSPSRKSNYNHENNSLRQHSTFQARTSRSLSDVSCSDNLVVSSLVPKTNLEDDLCHLSSLSDPRDPESNNTYGNAVSGVSDQDSNPEIKESSGSLHTVPRVGNLTQELYKLSKYGWYWGPINRSEAEDKLIDQPDGAFLVRDSSDDRYILSLSFRSYGKTLHTRIEHSSGLFSFYFQPEPEGHTSIVELITESMCYSQSGVFCYSRSRSPGSPSFPVRLTKPISRFTQVRSLQYLCRFVIRQYTRYDHIQKLPLPSRLKGYLEEGHY